MIKNTLIAGKNNPIEIKVSFIDHLILCNFKTKFLKRKNSTTVDLMRLFLAEIRTYSQFQIKVN